MVSATAGMTVAHVINVSGKDSSAGTSTATSLLRLAGVFTGACGVASYITVGRKSPQPRLLHIYGVLLIATAMSATVTAVADLLIHEGSSDAGRLLYMFTTIAWGVHRCLFFTVVSEKLMVLGPPEGRCRSILPWGRALIASTCLLSLATAIAKSLYSILSLQGWPHDVLVEAASPFPPDEIKVPLVLQIIYCVCLNLIAASIMVFLVSATGYMLVAFRLTRGVRAALAARGVALEVLARVQAVLVRHWLGLALTLSTSMAVFFSQVVDALDLTGQEEFEGLIDALVYSLDNAGDIVGLLLLSGIGTLVLREDPEAADVNGYIRGLLRGAVLSGRADFAFEGRVVATESRRCIASFPGNYVNEWKAMTWLCDRGELSSACVFLPVSDPQRRYGQHSICPDTPGRCWCFSLYGQAQPWGCRWFEAWTHNIERAVALGLDLVVVFFPGQAGEGLVEWDDLPSADLWDGFGLGGSQKGEAAYLRQRGIGFIMEDLQAARGWLNS